MMRSDGRGAPRFGGLSLDLKLGFRMIAKYPGLTVVGGLAMAFGIWFGAVTFQMFGILTSTKLPLSDGDRIVKIESVDLRTGDDEERVLYDYQLWRGLRSVTDLGAYRDASANLVGSDGSAQPAFGAAVTAAAFRIAPARPRLGRVLEAADERPGAAAVVLLGYEVWQKRFGGDPGIVGRNVQLGGGFATVVGVMPEGYAFPCRTSSGCRCAPTFRACSRGAGSRSRSSAASRRRRRSRPRRRRSRRSAGAPPPSTRRRTRSSGRASCRTRTRGSPPRTGRA
jgi:hypothetical protein